MILNLNIQGLYNNLDELKYVLKVKKPDICLLSETHCTENLNNGEISINGYWIIRCDSINPRTGGSAIYIKKNIKILNSKIYKCDVLWITSTEIETTNGNIIICSVYLSADGNKNQILNEIKKWFEQSNLFKNYVICGDFNIDIAKKNNA